ncbi:hypothetical protein FGG08_003192 [Glutinoglossum americanum]|uniref:Cytokinin riboside 5'-monophosphate phosphoribohydrolase n=1 Tax=Glutinoglossum americanum TaxID=1670608 RepID=A0A9P8I4W6_9PEZI|nr:hypothetical protein FGG08_003192 [Glutinoglossum americanum]
MTQDESSITANGVPSPSATDTTKPTIICVFCGARPGSPPAYLAAARALAQAMHEQNIHLVYGGGTVGLMGELARTLVSLSGPSAVHGIIPAALVSLERQGKAPEESMYGRTTVVPDMHTRKRMMAQEVVDGGPGGGFVALPGGYGTLEELMETVTWNQLGIHSRGICIFNVEGYWDGMIQWIEKSVASEFVSPANAGIIVQASTAEEVVRSLKEYKVVDGRMNLNWSRD